MLGGPIIFSSIYGAAINRVMAEKTGGAGKGVVWASVRGGTIAVKENRGMYRPSSGEVYGSVRLSGDVLSTCSAEIFC